MLHRVRLSGWMSVVEIDEPSGVIVASGAAVASGVVVASEAAVASGASQGENRVEQLGQVRRVSRVE